MRLATRHFEFASVALRCVSVIVQQFINDSEVTAHVIIISARKDFDVCNRVLCIFLIHLRLFAVSIERLLPSSIYLSIINNMALEILKIF